MIQLEFKYNPRIMRIKKLYGKLLGRHKVFNDVYIGHECVGCINNNYDSEIVTANVLTMDDLIVKLLDARNVKYKVVS